MAASTPDDERPAQAVGWLGLDAPLELIEAAGFRPQRILADLDDAPGGAAIYGEGGGHPWMRATADSLMSQARNLEAVILCSTPVNELWLYNFLLSLQLRDEGAAFPRAELLNLSHEPRPSALRLNLHSLRALADRLAPGVAEAALEAAIAGRNRVRARLREIDGLRRNRAGAISGAQARRWMDAADSMTSQTWLDWIAPELAAAPLAAGGLPVVLSSAIPPAIELYEALEARGFRIVADDADIGSRAIGPDADGASDPFESLVKRYAARFPAPAGWSTEARVAWLLDLVQTSGVQAVLFDQPAWSHPAAWDYPTERRALEAAGVACVELPSGTPLVRAIGAREALASLFNAETAHG